MKKGISFIIPIFIFFLTNPFVGFTQKREKMDGALRAFIETPFMQKFKDLRLESENLVLTFKENKQNYSASEINRVKTAYQKTVDKFNAQLLDIKADFMNERNGDDCVDENMTKWKMKNGDGRNAREEKFSGGIW